MQKTQISRLKPLRNQGVLQFQNAGGIHFQNQSGQNFQNKSGTFFQNPSDEIPSSKWRKFQNHADKKGVK